MFDTIATHERPHLDEYAAIFLLKKFGESRFPGISKARIVYWSPFAEKIGDRCSVDEYEKTGSLFIGVGGGRFDEHPAIGGERKQGECAATLVAKALGIADDPSLEKILKFALNNDIKAAASPFDLAYITKIMHQRYPDNSDKVMEWVMAGLEAKYQEQDSFFNEAKKEFYRMAKIEEIITPRGMLRRMATVVSDDEQINKLARSAYGGNTAIIIQKKSSGHVQIFTNQHYGLTLYDIAQILRLAEQKAKGKIITKDWKVLASEGKVAGAEEWFFFQAGQMLLNGSLTATGVPATKIPLEQIQEIVRIGINPNAFEPKFSSRCKRGICAVSLIKGERCPWYEFGLQRCRKIRFEMRKK
ncbi:MAG: hypothetical protein AAB514_01230 [Patescibacteria group bacterium]